MTKSNSSSVLSKEQIDEVVGLYSSGKYQEAINKIQILNEACPNVPLLFNLIGACYKALGQLESSAIMFKKAVSIKTNYAEAHKNLGIVQKNLGMLEDSIQSFKHAVFHKSDYLDAHYHLANSLKDNNQLDDAVSSYEKVILISPGFAQAHNNLGNALNLLGRPEEALQSYLEAIELNPSFVQAHNNLGNTFKDLNQFDNAIKSYKKAIKLNPNFAEAHNNLGNTLKDDSQLNEAIKSYKKAIDINPKFEQAFYNLGIAYKFLHKNNQAVDYFKSAIEINPNFAKAYNNLGAAYTALGELKIAVECYEKAINIDSNYDEAYRNLGFNLLSIGQVDLAIKCFKNAIEINPNLAEAHSNLGNAFKKQKLFARAMKCYETAYKINPDLEFILGDILNNKMNICDWNKLQNFINKSINKIKNTEKTIGPFSFLSLSDNIALQKKVSETFSNFYYPKSNILPNIKLYSDHNKIRIGYFSGDFRIHPVATLTAELYELHNRSHFEVHAFSFGPDTKDKMNLRIKEGVDFFHDVKAMSHKEIALLVRSHEIDIAIDLAGHTAKSRTNVFAMSAAPIQLSYIGYLGTMGADYYDYLIADPIMIPEESQKHYVEKIVYLPSFQVNDSKDLPPNLIMNRNDLGLPETGFIFCCFNNTYKITPKTFDGWARILKHVEGSVLIVYANNELSQSNLKKEIKQRGVDPKRLIFGERLARAEYLARYRVADLFLDTHPYNAGTTASDALKMGLPILTMKGESYQARMGSSIVNAVNLPELITNSQEDYESLAIELATNPDKLRVIKEKLAGNLTTAPLYDTKLFVKNIESAYTQMYERHHKGLEPDHIYISIPK